MAHGKDADGRSSDGGRESAAMALTTDLERSLRHLDDAQPDRLLDATVIAPGGSPVEGASAGAEG